MKLFKDYAVLAGGQVASKVVAFLASERAAYLQGAMLDVDGGLTRTL